VTEKDTAIEAAVKAMFLAAVKEKSVRAAREAADRTEGRVPLPLVGRSDEPIAISNIPRPDRSKKQDK
jgi:hypothetical protein